VKGKESFTQLFTKLSRTRQITLMARSPRELALDRLERTVQFRLPAEGRPYRSAHIAEALSAAGVLDALEAIGQREHNHLWETTFQTKEAKEAFLQVQQHTVKGYNVSVNSARRTGHRMRVVGLPYWVQIDVVQSALRDHCNDMRVVHWRHDIDKDTGRASYSRYVVVETERPDRIPDNFKYDTEGCKGTAYISVFGRAPLCYRCSVRGHRRAECTTPQCENCSGYHAEGEACIAGPRRSWADRAAGRRPAEAQKPADSQGPDVYQQEVVGADGAAATQPAADATATVEDGEVVEMDDESTVAGEKDGPREEPTDWGSQKDKADAEEEAKKAAAEGRPVDFLVKLTGMDKLTGTAASTTPTGAVKVKPPGRRPAPGGAVSTRPRGESPNHKRHFSGGDISGSGIQTKRAPARSPLLHVEQREPNLTVLGPRGGTAGPGSNAASPKSPGVA